MNNVESLALLIVGGLLIAAGVMPVNPFYARYAVFLEWSGAFLAFTAISHLLDAKFALTLASSAFIVGSVGDFVLIGAPNQLGWTVTNYMVFIHALTGALAGRLVKRIKKQK